MMSSIWNVYSILAFYGIIFGIGAFIFFFAELDDTGINGAISRFLMVKVPKAMRISLKFCFGQKVLSCCEKTLNYIAFERNPILLYTYLILVNSAFLWWLVFGAPYLPNFLVPKYHLYLSIGACLFAQYMFFKACTVSPGVINKENIHCFAHQQYDGLLYSPGLYCTTCKIPKLARSKHCSLCGHCVPLFDHHCVWLNQCVGELNYKYFLTFLAVNASFLLYGSYVLVRVILSEVYEKNLLNATFVNRRTGQQFKASWWTISHFILNKELFLIGLLMLAFVMGITVFLFMCYHLYLLAIGKTTNETFKWDVIWKAHKAMTRTYKEYQKSSKENPKPDNINSISNNVLDKNKNKEIQCNETIENTKKTEKTTISEKIEEKNTNKPGESGENKLEEPCWFDDDDDTMVGCAPAGFSLKKEGLKDFQKHPIRIAIERHQKLEKAKEKKRKRQKEASKEDSKVHFKEDPKIDSKEDSENDFEENEEEVIDPGSFPNNLYRIGFFSTLKRVYFPPSEPFLKKLDKNIEDVDKLKNE